MEEFPQPLVAEFSLPGSSQLEPVSMGLPQAEVPLSTETGGGPDGSPQEEDSIFCGALYGSPQPKDAKLTP